MRARGKYYLGGKGVESHEMQLLKSHVLCNRMNRRKADFRFQYKYLEDDL